MDHAIVRDWIDEAFFAPGARDADDEAARGARAHLAQCVECAAYDEQTRRVALKLDLARGPSPEVRTRVLAAARRTQRPDTARQQAARPAAGQPWWRTALAWRLAAAALVIAVVGVGAGAWWANASHSDSDADHLTDAVAMMSTLASQPGAVEVVLRDAAGNGSGMAVVSAASHQLAVFATHLPAAVAYHCYLERGGQRTWLGRMYVTPGVQFWAGDMDAGIDMQPGDRLVVAADADQPMVLSATL
ncbi:MAG TPA: anti-sigma factor [Candidatus Limnocylindrales bacterium]|nr:anti-sigma factor [Candidatus Limnocylindrales bacterium]